MERTLPDRIVFGDYEFDFRTGELRGDEGTIRLSDKPCRLLSVLLERSGELVTRDELQRHLWPNETVVDFEHGINTAIKRLRDALGDSAEHPKYIETIPRRGYRLVAQINRPRTQPTAPAERKRDHPPDLTEPSAYSLVGKRVSHYRVLEVIGGGGMGMVYKAEDLKLDRRVALKVLPEELASDPIALQRFEREARTASSLNHPNICTIYGVEEYQEQAVLVMELLEGETLRDRLTRAASRKERLALDEQLKIALALVAGIGAAHAKAIIHRDIKPANIFLTDTGQVKILDFGLAKPIQATRGSSAGQSGLSSVQGDDPSTGECKRRSDVTVTHTASPIGTSGYMSPEQVRGEKLDTRTDLFSLGLVLYEMATGQRAFVGETVDSVQQAILERDPIPVRSLNPSCPDKLCGLIEKCLEKNREHRYQSAEEVKGALECIPFDTGTAYSSFGHRFSRRARVAAGVLFTALLMIGILYVSREKSARHLNIPRTLTIARIPRTSNAVRLAISPDGRYLAYARADGEKRNLILREVATGVETELVAAGEVVLQDVSFSPDGGWIYYLIGRKEDNNYSVLYRMPVRGGPSVELIRNIDSAPNFSPDGKQFVFVRGASDVSGSEVTQVLISNTDGGPERLLASVPASLDFLLGPAWSPDGHTIAVAADQHGQTTTGYGVLLAISVADGAIRQIYTATARLGRPRWFPNGSALIVPVARSPGEPGGQLWQISFPSGEARRLTNDLTDYELCCLDMTRNGDAIVDTESGAVADIWLAPGGGESRSFQITANERVGATVSWMQDGKVLYTGEDGSLITVDHQSIRRVLLSSQGDRRRWPAACPDGQYIVFVRSGEHEQTLWRVNANGANPSQLVSAPLVAAPSCSGGGTVFFRRIHGDSEHASDDVMLVPIAGTDAAKVLVTDKITFGPSISPDGKLIAYVASPTAIGKPWQLKVIRSDDASPAYQSEWPFDDRPHWSPHGDGIQFVVQRGGSDNVWEQKLDGGSPRQITHFRSGTIFNFEWSPDGRQLALIRGSAISDIVSIKGFYNLE